MTLSVSRSWTTTPCRAGRLLSLIEIDVSLDLQLNANIHDREIRLDDGWVIKIGRGLDFYQKPDSWYEIGVTDLSLRKCLETKVDIFQLGGE